MERENILGDFYSALVDDTVHNFDKIHIPRSEVFYARSAYFNHSGDWVSLDRMERAMYLEGMLRRSDVLDPDRKRDWE